MPYGCNLGEIFKKKRSWMKSLVIDNVGLVF